MTRKKANARLEPDTAHAFTVRLLPLLATRSKHTKGAVPAAMNGTGRNGWEGSRSLVNGSAAMNIPSAVHTSRRRTDVVGPKSMTSLPQRAGWSRTVPASHELSVSYLGFVAAAGAPVLLLSLIHI